MRSRLRSYSVSLAAFAFLAVGAASPAQAQMAEDSPQWTVDARGGVAVPAGDLADLPLDDVAPALGLGVGYHLTPRIAIRADGAAEFYTGEQDFAPDVRFFHYNAGLEFDVIKPGQGPWDLTANVAGGGTTWDTDAGTGPGGGPGEFSETYFSVNGGLKVGYDVASYVNAYVGGQWYLQFTDEEETRVLAEVSPDLSEGFDSASSVPLYVGLKFKL